MKKYKYKNPDHHKPLTIMAILREKSNNIFSELNLLLLRHFKSQGSKKFKKYPVLSKDEHQHMLDLTSDYSDIQNMIEERK